MVQKCGYSEKFPKPVFKCSYIEFGENLTVKLNEMDSTVEDFWNEIDDTMVKIKPNHQIEVTQIVKTSPLHQTFMPQH